MAHADCALNTCPHLSGDDDQGVEEEEENVTLGRGQAGERQMSSMRLCPICLLIC